jgi:hypothetical protein
VAKEKFTRTRPQINPEHRAAALSGQRNTLAATLTTLMAEMSGGHSSPYRFFGEQRFYRSSRRPLELDCGLNHNRLADINVNIPSEYCCPISLCIMTEPVYIDGDLTRQHFERVCLVQWLNSNSTHPLTRLYCEQGQLILNSDLQYAINVFVDDTLANVDEMPKLG